ncbi:Hsp20/alpha crystallin family protein [bacterium]|nr:Hsp20/alpha crystallin family protein [candidate division CSSED10-310 bacterium]
MDENAFKEGKEFKEVSDQMERIFDNLVQQPLMMISESGWRPAFDVFETKDNLVILGELAGVLRKDISIVLDKEVLTISGCRQDKRPEKKERLHRMEIDFGKFKRQIRINIPIREGEIHAVMKDGFLEITIPKIVRDEFREIPIDQR